MKNIVYLLILATFLSFDTYAIEQEESPNINLEAHTKEGWQLDLEAFGKEFVLTNCVELPKLESMLNEGHLRIPTPQEWATGYVYGRLHGKRSQDFKKEISLNEKEWDGNKKEISTVIDALWQVVDDNIIEEDPPFKQLLHHESKMFLGVSPRSIQREQYIDVNQMYGVYRAIFVYSPEILEGRDDYIISKGQENALELSEFDYFPGQAANFLKEHSHHPHLHTKSEIKFTGSPISNQHLLCLRVDDEIKEQFLAQFKNFIIEKEGEFLIQVLGCNNKEQKSVPLDFVPFIRPEIIGNG